MQVRGSSGSTIAVHDMGGRGEPLLICHATGFCSRAYSPFAELLAVSHHVYGVDLRGHGDSPPTDDLNFEWFSIAEDVTAAVRAISSGPVHVFGHSIGGAVALQAEASVGGLFQTAFVFEPIIFPPGSITRPVPNPMADSARRRKERFSSREEALWRFSNRPPLEELSASSLAAYVEHGFTQDVDGSVQLKCRAQWEALTYEATGAITTETIAGVEIPVVVCVGDEPDSSLSRLGPVLVAALANATLRVLEGVGHFGPLEAPRQLAGHVLSTTTAARSTLSE